MINSSDSQHDAGLHAASIMVIGYYRYTLPTAWGVVGIGTLLALIYGVTAGVGKLVFGLPGWPPVPVDLIAFVMALVSTATLAYVVLPIGFAAYGLLRGVPRL